MDGFGEAVGGYFDVEDLLSRYLLQRAKSRLGSSGGNVGDVESRADAEAHRERVRSFLPSSIGGLPDRPADLAVETTDRHERGGYAIECVAFESRPDYHVTANCYAPDGDGPHPGILFLCGHAGPAREDGDNRFPSLARVSVGIRPCTQRPLRRTSRASNSKVSGRVSTRWRHAERSRSTHDSPSAT